MLKVFRLLVCLSIIWNSVSGQDIVFEKKFDFDKGSQKICSLEVVGERLDNNMALLLFSNAESIILTLDSNFNQLEMLKQSNPHFRYKKIKGICEIDNKYYSYFYNANKQVVLVHIFNPIIQETDVKEIQLELKKGEYIQGIFPTGGTLYFVTLLENSSTLSLYEIKGEKAGQKKVYQLNDSDFPHYLSDNLYNCINHDLLRPINSDLIPEFVFADKEDYITYSKEKIYIVSNTNTVIEINLITKEVNVNTFPIDYACEKKNNSIFKNFSKNTRVRSAVNNDKYFRISEYREELTLQIFDLKNANKLFEKILKSEDISKALITSDYSKNDQWIKEDFIRNLTKGSLAFRVYRQGDTYKLNFGRNIDRLFELYYGYYEYSLDINTMESPSSTTLYGDYNRLRRVKQNMNYEYLEVLNRDKKDNLYLIQYDIKERKLQIID